MNLNALTRQTFVYGRALHRCSTSYTSAYSLNTIYPPKQGHVSLKQKLSVDPSLSDNFNGYIPQDALQIQYSRSSGPGGQHVNKAKSQAEVRFKLSDAEWIRQDVRDMLAQKYKHKLTKDGDLVVRSQRTRVASLNLADCLDKIRSTIQLCEEHIQQQNKQPDSQTLEFHEQRKKLAAQRRLKEKRERSYTKNMRSDDF